MNGRFFLFVSLGLLWLTACAGAEPIAATSAPSPTPSVTPAIGVTLTTRLPSTIAIVQITPSPLPTATPTPTATPIVFTIDEGDTLLGIALQNGTTVEGIQGLNPEVNPYLLQIGQQIILPPPATPIFQPGDPTPLPLNLTITALNGYRTPVGGLWLLGSVRNDAPVAAENARVQITLVGEAGATLGDVTAWVAPSIVAPGETAPFGILLPEPPTDYAAPAAAVIAGDALTDLGNRTIDLAVVETAVTIEDDRVRVTGRVHNNGSTRAGQITLVITAFDAQARVSGYRLLTLPDALAADDSVPFAVEMAPPGGPTVRVALLVEGRRLPDIPAP